jgi:hypothetical protein
MVDGKLMDLAMTSSVDKDSVDRDRPPRSGDSSSGCAESSSGDTDISARASAVKALLALLLPSCKLESFGCDERIASVSLKSTSALLLPLQMLVRDSDGSLAEVVIHVASVTR